MKPYWTTTLGSLKESAKTRNQGYIAACLSLGAVGHGLNVDSPDKIKISFTREAWLKIRREFNPLKKSPCVFGGNPCRNC